jgi:hypothetical protein
MYSYIFSCRRRWFHPPPGRRNRSTGICRFYRNRSCFYQRAEVTRQIFFRFFNGFVVGGAQRHHNGPGGHRDFLRHKSTVGADQRNSAFFQFHHGEKTFLAGVGELLKDLRKFCNKRHVFSFPVTGDPKKRGGLLPPKEGL